MTTMFTFMGGRQGNLSGRGDWHGGRQGNLSGRGDWHGGRQGNLSGRGDWHGGRPPENPNPAAPFCT